MADETTTEPVGDVHEVTFGYEILTAEEAGIHVTDEMRARAEAARAEDHGWFEADARTATIVDAPIPIVSMKGVGSIYDLADPETDDDSIEGDAVRRS